MINPTEIASKLASFYPAETIIDIEELTDGWETEIFAFRLLESDRRHIVRIFNDDEPKARWEFDTMGKLSTLGYPVPTVHHFADEESPFDGPCFTMDWIEGQQLGGQILAADQQRGRQLAAQFCQLIVDLHALEWETLFEYPFNSRDPFAFIDAKLAEYQQAIKHFSLTEAEPVLEWLRLRRDEVPCMRLSITHNDLHPWNVLLTPQDHMFVIDWPNAEIADPRYDLAWTLLLIGAYTNPQIADQLLEAYRDLSGHFVQHMDYFRVLAILRRLGTILISLQIGADQLGMREEATARMRDKNHMQVLRDLLVQDTGLRLPSVEQLLAEE